ncbi:hypothetical protein GT354_09750, partial [Streptomyces sp. SID3343]|nr:hypothetical protein [Streptomyces sp. SID3343]
VTAAITGGRAGVGLPAVTAGNDGTVTFTWTAPEDAVTGSYSADLVDQGDGGTARAAFEVATSTNGGGSGGGPSKNASPPPRSERTTTIDEGGTGNPSRNASPALLPRTGTDPAPLVALALTTCAVGIALRRRSREHPSSTH